MLPTSAIEWVGTAALGFAALYWGWSVYAAVMSALRVPRVADLRAEAPAAWPRVSVIVPARNEVRTLEAAMRSKLADAYPNVEFVIVDDRSTDGTSELVDRLAAADPRIRAAHVTSLPDGWLGKLNALELGRRAATGEWILLSDADVHLSPTALSRVIAWCESTRTDFFAVIARIWPVTPFIDAITAAMIRLTLVAGRPWNASNPSSKASVGVGAFNLVRRTALEGTGGFEWLKMETADDVALGQMMKLSGARCAAAFGGDDVGLAFLHDLGEAKRSSEKAADVFRFQLLPALVMPATVALVELGPWIGLFAFGVPAVQLLSALCVVASLAVAAILVAKAQMPLVGSLLQPIGGALMIWLLIRAGVKAWRLQGIEWRGTVYPADQLLAGKRFRPQ